MIIAIGC